MSVVVIHVLMALAGLGMVIVFWPEFKWLILGGWRDLGSPLETWHYRDRRRSDHGPPAMGERRRPYGG